jgi:glucoamylase
VHIVHHHERFELTLRIAPCAERDALLIELALSGEDSLRPYALLAPHIGGTGHDNRVCVADHRGHRLLLGEQGPFALALAAVDPDQHDAWGRASCGYVGTSDGWQDFACNGAMRWEYERAGPGNVALLGELPRKAVLALGISSSTESAATLALSALFEPFEVSWQRQVNDWTQWQQECSARASLASSLPRECREQFQVSTMVLRAHHCKTFPGAMVASLSVPWGNTKDERAGYHLVWPRDLCECAGALLAYGATREALDTLRYLRATQLADGHWNQNQWLGGTPYWTAVQLDETAFPVLLAGALHAHKALDGMHVAGMIHSALSFIVRNGPVSDQDRWEEDAGINTFTLSACIAALVCGASHLEPAARELALAVADYWNASLEDWTAVYDTPLTREHGIPGYYVRVAPADALHDRSALQNTLPIRNQTIDPNLPADAQVGVDFLQLVRFGLRAPDDPLVLGTMRLVDALLKVDTPSGPCWHRYNDDGYGEHDDGSAYDGTGRARALRAGRRARPSAAASSDGPHGLQRRDVAGASLGWRTHPQALPRAGPTDRQRHAPGVGTRRVHQARRLARHGPALRPARTGLASLWRQAPSPEARVLVAACPAQHAPRRRLPDPCADGTGTVSMGTRRLARHAGARHRGQSARPALGRGRYALAASGTKGRPDLSAPVGRPVGGPRLLHYGHSGGLSDRRAPAGAPRAQRRLGSRRTPA